MQQAIIWSNIGRLCWHIYASLGLNEGLMESSESKLLDNLKASLSQKQ